MVRGSGPGGIDLYQNKAASFDAYKSAASSTNYANEEEAYKALDKQFYSDGAVALNFFGSMAKDFHDHGGAYTLNAKINNTATAANNGNTNAAKSNTATSTATAPKATVTRYRGVNEENVAYQQAVKGTVSANGGTATPLEHNTSSTLNSPYTSWTTNPEVAKNYALRPAGSGVVLTAQIPISQTVVSPNTKRVNLAQSPGTVVSESEVLVTGTVTGASVQKVKN
ncbi:MAG: hypothetical protein QM687_14385 [Ferruginibacter sp.]